MEKNKKKIFSVNYLSKLGNYSSDIKDNPKINKVRVYKINHNQNPTNYEICYLINQFIKSHNGSVYD